MQNLHLPLENIDDEPCECMMQHHHHTHKNTYSMGLPLQQINPLPNSRSYISILANQDEDDVCPACCNGDDVLHVPEHPKYG